MNRFLQRMIGFILVSPAVFSVFAFFVGMVIRIDVFDKLSGDWMGHFYVPSGESGGGGGATSALPIYFGLMAIAGVYLLKRPESKANDSY